MRMFWSKFVISPRTSMFSIAYAHDWMLQPWISKAEEVFLKSCQNRNFKPLPRRQACFQCCKSSFKAEIGI